MSKADEGFLGRWSRLKRQDRSGNTGRERSGDARHEDADAVPSGVRPSGPDGPGPLPSPPDLPPLDSLTPQSDYAPFLAVDVPETVQRNALRRLWASDSFFHQADNLDIHNQDHVFPAAKTVVSTLWRLGQGMVENPDKSRIPMATASNRYDSYSIAQDSPSPVPACANDTHTSSEDIESSGQDA